VLHNFQSPKYFFQILPNCIWCTPKFVLISFKCKLLSSTTLESYTTHIWTHIDLKFWCNMKNYVYYHLWKFQLIWLHKMKNLVTFLKPPQTRSWKQNDLQLLLNNSKPLDISRDTLNIILPHLFKISALLMMIKKIYHFQMK
jgi:hypothetical protein